MIRYFYKWRYKRREKRPAFSFHHREHEHFGPAFGHYLSQKGSHQVADNPIDKRQRRKKVLKTIIILATLALMGWLVVEIIYAIRFF